MPKRKASVVRKTKLPVVWIYGPSGCGKTTLAGLLGQYFNAREIHDCDDLRTVRDAARRADRCRLRGGKCLLVLSIMPPQGQSRRVRVLTFWDARRLASEVNRDRVIWRPA